MIYFIHFFGIRIIISLLIGLSDVMPSLILWSLFLGFQIAFFVLNVFKIYEKMGMRLISMMSELLLLGVSIYGVFDLAKK